ncbi:MAG: pyridoxal-phosphate-dependent aminotransferase family protein [Fidelibacterota bacterium]
MKPVRLFIPGPVDVAPEVLAAMMTPMIGHRSVAFSDLHHDLTLGIGELMFTGQHVYLGTCSATGLWEATIRNLAPRKTLCCVNGAFSRRWYTTIKDNGFDADLLEIEWGRAIHPDDIRRALRSGNYQALTLVHNETSTGVASPLKAIGVMLRTEFPDLFFAVDAVSSVVGMPIRFDDWGIDILLASVQKAWALPPGFSICVVSDRTLKRSATVKNKGYYFDFVAWEKKARQHQTIVTPSIPHMFGLKKQLERIWEEGLTNRFRRYRDLAEYTRTWARSQGQEMFSESGYHSDTVSCIQNDAGWDLEGLGHKLLRHGYQFSNGYGRLRSMTFRIPHMGETSRETLVPYLDLITRLVH